MSHVAITNNEKSKIFQTILCSPGMYEKCKINLIMSRQNILLLSRLIEAGLLSDQKQFEDDIINGLQEGSIEEFKSIHTQLLQRGNLSEFYEHMKTL